MAHEKIAHQQIGDAFNGIYYVESAYVKQTVHGKDYMDMMLRDRSGSRNVKHWARVKDLEKGCFVFVAAVVQEFEGAPSIIANNIEIVEKPESMDEYIAVYDGASELADEFDQLRSELKNETCEAIVDEVYRSGSFFDKFVRCPGSDGPSYGKVGGLLANVVRVARHAMASCSVYDASEEERDVLLATSLLCRVGIADAYHFHDCMPVMTDQGLLLGSPTLTMNRLTSALRRSVASASKEGKSIDQEIVMRIFHAVVASTGNCGVMPMTKEAMIISKVVEMDAEMVDAMDFMENDINTEERFTAYDSRMGRRYFRG